MRGTEGYHARINITYWFHILLFAEGQEFLGMVGGAVMMIDIRKQKCKISGCDNKYYALGLCDYHFKEWELSVKGVEICYVRTVPLIKKCKSCGVIFTKGYYTYCIKCWAKVSIQIQVDKQLKIQRRNQRELSKRIKIYTQEKEYKKKYISKCLDLFVKLEKKKPSQRNQLMISYRREGKTLECIGNLFNISRERVRQICKQYNVIRRTHGTA